MAEKHASLPVALPMFLPPCPLVPRAERFVQTSLQFFRVHHCMFCNFVARVSCESDRYQLILRSHPESRGLVFALSHLMECSESDCRMSRLSQTYLMLCSAFVSAIVGRGGKMPPRFPRGHACLPNAPRKAGHQRSVSLSLPHYCYGKVLYMCFAAFCLKRLPQPSFSSWHFLR